MSELRRCQERVEVDGRRVKIQKMDDLSHRWGARALAIVAVAAASASGAPARPAPPRPAARAARTVPGRAGNAVSVVIPAYRAAATIGRALDSVLAQTSAPREVIVVDDGSPDDLDAALARFDGRVTLIRKPNGGASSARNTGIERAGGDIIAFLDADDYWEPHKLARQLDLLGRLPEVGLVGAGLYLEEPGGTARRPDPAIDPTLFDRVLHLAGPDAFHAAGMFWTGTVAVRRDVLGDARFDESLATAEDRDLWLRLLLRSPAYLVGEPLATCVLVPGSLSRDNVERDCKNMLAVVDRYREVLGEPAHRHWIGDVHRRWSARLLAEGDPRGAFKPALVHLRHNPSPRALWTVVKSAALGAGEYLPRRRSLADHRPADGPSVTTVTGVAGFAALREEWSVLHERSDARTTALTWDWLFTWWEVFGPGRELNLLVAREAGRLIGIAPLVRRTIRPRGVPIRHVELLATGEAEADEILSEYLDFIIERGREVDVIAAFWRHLSASSDWDEVCLASVPAESPLVPALRDVVARTGAPVDITTRARPDAVIVTLGPDAKQFLATQDKRMREDLRRHRRMLEQHGPVTMRRAETHDDLRAMFPVLVRLHQALWQSRGKPGCFASPLFTRFHERLSERMLARGLLHLHVIDVGGRPVAARYGFHVGDHLIEYQSGSDPEFDPRISTGVQAAQLCMEAAIARGFVAYDLGEGPRPYKLRWNHVRRQTLNVWITRRNPRTLALALVTEAEAQVRTFKRGVDARRGATAPAPPARGGGASDDT